MKTPKITSRINPTQVKKVKTKLPNNTQSHIHTPPKTKPKNALKLTLLGLAAGLGIIGGTIGQKVFKHRNKHEITYNQPIAKQTYFKTLDDAFNYGKQRILYALNTPSPYEHMVVIDKKTNKILVDTLGDAFNTFGTVKAEDLIGSEGMLILHGHPQSGNGLTLPLGFTDFKALVDNPYAISVTAFSKDGKHSVLRKENGFQPIDSITMQKIKKSIGMDLAKESFKVNAPEMYKILGEIVRNPKDSIELNKALRETTQYLEDQDTTQYFIRGMHKFWEENAPKMKLKYITNFIK